MAGNKLKLFFVLMVLFVPCVAFGAFPDGWSRTMSMRVSSEMAGRVLYVNADMLIANDVSVLDADGGLCAKNGGGDIVVADRELNRFPVEIVTFMTNNDPALATVEMYVLLPTDYNGPYVYFFYGNPTATQPGVSESFGRNAVWSSYAYVSHNGGSTDSTGNTADATNIGGISVGGVAGKMGVASDLNGTSQYFEVPDDDDLSFGNGTNSNPFTFQAWIKPDSWVDMYIFNKGGWIGEGRNAEEYNLGTAQDGYLYAFVADESNGHLYGLRSSSAIGTTGAWTKIEYTYNGDPYSSTPSADMSVYRDRSIVNGTNADSGVPAYVAMENKTAPLHIGFRQYNAIYSYANGAIDELRLCKEIIPDNVLALEFTNENTPVDFAEASPSASIGSSDDWYIRPSGSVYGIGDGSTYENAWSGYADVDWASVLSRNIIYDSSNESYVLDDLDFILPVTIDGRASVIDGATTINNNDFVNVSGNLWKVLITENDIDYQQVETPSNPSVGEKWFVTRSDAGDAHLVSLVDHSGRAYEWDGVEWRECNFFHRPASVWVDGALANQASVTASATTNSTSATATAFGGHANNYWVGSIATIRTRVWQADSRIITASADNTITFDALNSPSGVTSPTTVTIYGNLNEPNAEGEWAYDGAGYLYVYSADPTAHTWEYSDASSGILIRNSNNIKIINYNIKRTNDCGILVYKSDNVDISNNNIIKPFPNTFFYFYGAIAAVGKNYLETKAVVSPELGTPVNYADNSFLINIYGNTIEDVQSGSSGVFVAYYTDSIISYNSIKNGVEAVGAGAGIRTYWSNNSQISNNNIQKTHYSGIQANFNYELSILNNIIKYPCQTYTDGGGIYIGFWAIDNLISGNRIENTPDAESVACVYVDSMSVNNVVENNYVWAHHGLTPDTATSFAAFFEHATGGLTGGNIATNNAIYDNDCQLAQRLVNGSLFPMWTGGGANTRYDETTYPYQRSTNSGAALFAQ